jgi:glycosyltransferase involved in cell wall biosynthesis
MNRLSEWKVRMKAVFIHLNRYQEIGATDFFELSQAFGRMLPGAVHVIVARDGESQANLAGSVMLHEIPVTTRRVWSRACIDYYRAAARLLCDLKPDLAIVKFDRGAALIPLIVQHTLGNDAPRFIHHICSVSFAQNPLRYRIGNLLTRLESYAFDGISTLSPAIAKEIYGAGFPRLIHIVPIGVNLEQFSFRAEARSELRQGFSKNELLFVYVGTLCASKNADHIIEAFALAKMGTGARLWMVGDGAMMGELREKVKSRSLANVQLLGRRDYDSIPGILSAADVSISHIEKTSRFFLQPPIKVLEYLAAGTTVLASDVPGNRFYMEGSEAARFYDPSGVEGLATGFREVFEEKSKQNMEDDRAKARATAEKFSWDRIASEMLVTLKDKPARRGAEAATTVGHE